jgi:ribose transport system permease protein
MSGGSNVFGLPRSVANFSSTEFLGLPLLFWVLILVAASIELVLRRTSFGRYVYALGSNPEAARLSGVNTRFVTYGVYTLASFLVGIAGVMETSRLWMGVPSTGTGYELDAIAAAVLGGTSLMGAEGTPAGAFIGALIMTTIYNGAVLLRVNPFWTRIIVGVILVVTVSVDQWRKRRAGE